VAGLPVALTVFSAALVSSLPRFSADRAMTRSLCDAALLVSHA
jgi:hypothetical protein